MGLNSRSRAVAACAVVAGMSLVLAACGLRSDGGSGGEADGVKTGPGFDGKTITVGAIATTSGPLAVQGELLLEGLNTYVDALNERGGIDGRFPVEVKVSDNGYNAAKAVQQVRDTLPQVAMYASLFGTPVQRAVIPQLEKDNAIAVSNTADGAVFRARPIISTLTPFESQVITGIEYASTQPGGRDKVYCGAYFEGDIAAASKRGATFALEELGLKEGTDVELPVTGTDYTPQVQQLKSAGCDVVSFVAPANATSVMMSDSSKLGFEPQFIGSNIAWTAALKDAPIVPFMQKVNFLMTYTGALYGDTTDAPGMEALMKAHKKYAPKALVDLGFMNGYSSGVIMERILTDALKSGDLSRDGVSAAQEALGELDFGGINGTLGWGGPDDRKVPSKLTIVEVDPSTESSMKTVEYGYESSVAAKYDYK